MLYPCKGCFGFYTFVRLYDDTDRILNTHFDGIRLPSEKDIKSIAGVVKSELFIGYNPEIIIARNKRNCLPQHSREFYLYTKSGVIIRH